MTGYLPTELLAELTGSSVTAIAAYHREGIISPAVPGRPRVGHLWSFAQGVAVGAGQVLRHYGLRGAPVNEPVRMIAARSEDDLRRVFETRPVLCVCPGVAVVSELVPREFVQARAAELLLATGVSPIGIDLERMYRKLLECIARREAEARRSLPAKTEADRA